MTVSDLERQIERSRRRLARLRERAAGERDAAASPLREAVEELGQILEELSVTAEELSSTNEELAEAQLAVEEHARRYVELFRHAPDACVITDGQGVILELNEMAGSKLGRASRYLVGKPLLSLVHEADRDAFLRCLALLGERRGRLEERLLRIHAEGEFDASVSAVAERRDGGLEIRWTMRDVTKWRRVETSLRASESRLRALAHSLHVPISFVDRDERYRFNNAAYEEWFGIPAEKITGMTVRELLGEEAYAKVRPYVAAALEGKPQLFEEELTLDRGGTRDVIVEYDPAVGENGGVEGFYALVKDVTPLRSAEREAREAETRIRAVLDAALDGIASVDETGAIRSVNPALCRIFGYEAESLIGRDAASLMGLGGAAGGGPCLAPTVVGAVRELEGVRGDGTRIPIQVSVGQVDVEEGTTFVATVHDLTGQRTLESRLRRAAAAATIAEDRERRSLASDLHDDVGQLVTLAGMKLGQLRRAAGDAGLREQVQELEDLVVRIHGRTESLTFQLSPPVLHDVGLAAAAQWLAEQMGRTYGLRVFVEAAEEPPLDEAVRVTLFRALRELLINVARHAGTHQARVNLAREGDTLTIFVVDGGTGFEPTRRTHGFGLVSLRERIEGLGGTFQIDSAPGEGTRARIVVPLSMPSPGPGAGIFQI